MSETGVQIFLDYQSLVFHSKDVTSVIGKDSKECKFIDRIGYAIHMLQTNLLTTTSFIAGLIWYLFVKSMI